MTDRSFARQFRQAVKLTEEHKDQSWTTAYLPRAKKLVDPLDAAVSAAEHAEAVWHKDAGGRLEVFDIAEERYRYWANHLKADVHGAELGEFIEDYHSAAGFDDALGRMIDAFGHHAEGRAHARAEGALPYAKEAVHDLEGHKEKVDAVILGTRTTWQAFRDAAAPKTALKAEAWEIYKSLRLHLKTDLGKTAAIKELQTPPRHPRPAVSKSATPTTTPTA